MSALQCALPSVNPDIYRHCCNQQSYTSYEEPDIHRQTDSSAYQLWQIIGGTLTSKEVVAVLLLRRLQLRLTLRLCPCCSHLDCSLQMVYMNSSSYWEN